MENETPRVATGVDGLDEVLHGGLLRGRTYLIRGGPGCGKTTLGYHFLTAQRDDSPLLITFGESEEVLRRDAAALDQDLSEVQVLDLSPSSSSYSQEQIYDLFDPATVEAGKINQEVTEAVRRLSPQRVFIDSFTQFRYLSPDPYQFRKQTLALMRLLTEHGATVLCASEVDENPDDEDLQFLCDGVLELKHTADRRHLNVKKFRGSDFEGGYHQARTTRSGLQVFPKLVPGRHRQPARQERRQIPSGVPALDSMLHGGLDRQTVNVLSGPTGVGKTTLGVQYMKEAAGRGERSVVYTFEETYDSFVERCEAVSLPVRSMIENGSLVVHAIEPLHYSADEFAHELRREVEDEGADIVMLDSLAGYRLSITGSEIVPHFHALCRYLINVGVTPLLINEVESIAGGDFRATEIGISYLVDTIVVLRYLEVNSALQKTIGVLKKRTGDFEKSLRGFEITPYGIRVGEPIQGLEGILTGFPRVMHPEAGEAPAPAPFSPANGTYG